MTRRPKTGWLIAGILVATLPFAHAELKRTGVEPLSKDTKRTTVEALADAMKANYFSEQTGVKAGEAVRARLAKGEYDKIEAGDAFAAVLTEHLNEVCKDAHLRVRFSKDPLPVRSDNREPSPGEVEEFEAQVKRLNGGFEKVERLAGNVGYIEVRGFMPVEGFRRPAQAAMEFVADTDALIIDLRRNGGGHPASVQYLCSYLFGETPVHLNTIVSRREGRTEYWTLKELPGKRYLDKEVYVLTSKRTGSAAEEFAYNLRSLKRATLVGESTWGGANPGGVLRLNDHFSAFIPDGQAINPYTKTNWEGTGVEPHVKVPASDALKTAHTAAIKSLLEKATKPQDKDRLQSALDTLEPPSQPATK